jgi:hypothetical protein
VEQRRTIVNDDFLYRYREDPSAEFAQALKQRLRDAEQETPEPEEAAGRRRAGRLGPALVSSGVLAAVLLAFSLPSVRAAARSFLDLFRVKRFVAVPVDPERLARLQADGLDLRSLVANQVEVLEPAREPEPADGVEEAAAEAGIAVRQPAVIPVGAAFSGVSIGRPGAFRVTVDVAKIELVARAVGVEDAEVPPEWNGATIEVHASPVVVLTYRRGEDAFVLLESRPPMLELPESIDLGQLGTLGLRMAGMSAEEARLFAGKIDWRSTLLVPIPVGGGTFREVEVRGRKGLLVSALGHQKAGTTASGRGRWRSILLWTEGEQGFALHGPGQGVEILEMAQSLR